MHALPDQQTVPNSGARSSCSYGVLSVVPYCYTPDKGTFRPCTNQRSDGLLFAGLLDLQLLPALSVQLGAFLAGQLPGQSAATHQQHPQQQHQQPNQQAASDHRPSDSPTINSIPAVVPPARVVEICCGILANLYSFSSLVPQLVAAEGLSAAVVALTGELTDPAALAELCRLFAAALSTPQVIRGAGSASGGVL
jgi:hypothetical protein